MREKHLQIMQARAELYAKQNELRGTDYKLLKFMDGELTEAQYKPIKTQRAALRKRIRELETIISEDK